MLGKEPMFDCASCWLNVAEPDGWQRAEYQEQDGCSDGHLAERGRLTPAVNKGVGRRQEVHPKVDETEESSSKLSRKTQPS
jgi:hypothetical protein